MKERRLRRTPHALRIQQEHDADLGVIARQAHSEFSKGAGKWEFPQGISTSKQSAKR